MSYLTDLEETSDFVTQTANRLFFNRTGGTSDAAANPNHNTVTAVYDETVQATVERVSPLDQRQEEPVEEPQTNEPTPEEDIRMREQIVSMLSRGVQEPDVRETVSNETMGTIESILVNLVDSHVLSDGSKISILSQTLATCKLYLKERYKIET